VAAALALMLLVASGEIAAGAAEPLSAILMVANSEVDDPDFVGSVVLVMNNLGPSPVGLVINRPTPVTVSRLFPKLKRLAGVQDKLYFGGPVGFGSVWFLIRASTRPKHAVPVLPQVYLSDSRRLLTELLSRSDPMVGLRIFVGHAGWTPRQLRDEIRGGAWALQQADADAIFRPRTEQPWPSQQAPKRGT